MFVILASLTSTLKEAQSTHSTTTTTPGVFSLSHDWTLPEQALSSLESILSTLLSPSSKVTSSVLGSAYLLQLLDNFKGTKKVLICKVSNSILQKTIDNDV